MSMPGFYSSPAFASALEPLRAKPGWTITLGVIYLVCGLIALGSVIFATVATVYFVGIMMVVAGAAEVFNAFQMNTFGKSLVWLLIGILYILAGFATFGNPLLAAALLTLLLGIALAASGVVRIVLGFSMRQGTPWMWVAASGLITLLLGLIILVRWPVSSLYILGLFLGIDLVVAGVSWIGLGFAFRRRA